VAALLWLALALASPHASLSPSPAKLTVGRPWRATLVVRPAPSAAPTVVARLGDAKPRRFATRRLASGRYRVVLRLPRPGRWQLAARVGSLTLRLRAVRVAAAPPPVSPVPGATAFRVCGGMTIPYPQNALAVGFGSAWIACSAQGLVERVDERTGGVTARIAVPAAVSTVATGSGAVWALGRDDTTLYRISPGTNRVSARVGLGAPGAYLWAVAGAVWVADDADRQLIRIDGDRVTARLGTGDGPSGLAFDGASLWLVSHRDNALERIDPASSTVTPVASGISAVETTAAERVAALGGSLWITGRGLDLLRLGPSGALLGRTEIGPAGIDVISDGSSLWVPAFTPAAAGRGDPVAGAILRLDDRGAVVSRATVTRRLFVNGFAAGDGSVWVLDGVAGLLLRLPT
jgi:DNA-binding beta-propeller fold protein YncE